MVLHTPVAGVNNSLPILLLKKYVTAAATGIISGLTGGKPCIISQMQQAQQEKKSTKIPTFEEKQAIKKAFLDKLVASPYGPIATKHIAAFEAEEASLQKELCTLANITPQQFQQKFFDYYNEAQHKHPVYPCNIDKNNLQAIPQSKRKCIDTVFHQAGIDPTLIDVVYYTEPRHPFSTSFFTIYIDPSYIVRNDDLYKANIAHELTHLLFDDYVIRKILLHYCGKKHKNLHDEYLRVQEKRADILGCLLSPAYSREMAHWFTDLRHTSTKNHPKPSVSV